MRVREMVCKGHEELVSVVELLKNLLAAQQSLIRTPRHHKVLILGLDRLQEALKTR